MPQQEDTEILSFLVDWYDPLPQIMRRFLLKFYVHSHSVEMFDVKNKRLFLRKCPAATELSTRDLTLGNKITVYRRELELVEYADGSTRDKLSNLAQRALILFTPETYAHWGKMVDFAQNAGSLTATDMRMVLLDDAAATRWLELAGTPRSEASAVRTHLQSNPCLVLGLHGNDALAKVDEVVAQLKGTYAAGAREPACMTVSGSNTPDGEASLARAYELFFAPSSLRTLPPTATLDSCTLCIVKPHALREGNCGKVLEAVLAAGYEVSAIETIRLDHAQAGELLEVYRGVVPEYGEQVEQLASGVALALELRAEDAVRTFRETAGPWDVEMAKELRPRSLRALYGQSRVLSAVHCTDLPEDGAAECQYVFQIVPRTLAGR